MAEPVGERYESGEPSSLVAVTRIATTRWPIVLAVVLIAVAAVLVVDLTTSKTYEASSQLLIGSSTEDIARIIDPNGGTSSDPDRDQATALLLAHSGSVGARAKQELKLTDSISALQGRIVTSAEPNADLIRVTASDPTAAGAARLANGWADAFVQLRTDANCRRVQDGIDLLQREIANVPVEDVDQRAQLEDDLSRVKALQVVENGNAEVVDAARVPGSASSPKPVRDGILALLAGLALGLGLAFLAEAFDRRVTTAEELEELLGLRALAAIAERNFEPASEQERQAALEPFRILRNGLSFLGAGGDVRVVVISSARPGEGRTSVATGLARACALAGESVVLVEGDLRRPSFVERFNLSPDAGGLTSALAGAPVSELFQPILPGLKSLLVLPAGIVPSNPAELMRGAARDSLLEQLSARAKIVIVDGPPLVGVADGRVLLAQPRVDACLVVARLRLFDRDDARSVRQILEQNRLVNAGLVVNGAKGADAEYGYYGRPARVRRTAKL